MATLNRNARAIEAVRAASKRAAYTIKGVNGLRLVVHPTGRKIWFVVYQQGHGATRKKRWVEVGPYASELPGWTLDKACEEARRIMGTVDTGLDPTAPSTFGELFEAWLTEHAKKNLATWADEERRYQLHLQSSLGSQKIEAIERKDVREIRDNVLEEAGPIQSNRVVALFNRVMNWAVDEDRAKFNPAARLKKVGEEQRRERVLTPEELKRVWHELAEPLVVLPSGGLNETDLEAAKRVRLALKLLIITGQRRGEVIGMQKAELGEDGFWTIPGERTKNGLPHRVPLTKSALMVIEQALQGNDTRHVFPSTKTEGAIRPDAVTKQLARLCARMKPAIEGLGPHDIRRTVGTTMRKLNISVEDRSHVFNHISGAKSKVTSWNYDAGEHDQEKLKALTAWGNYVEALIADRPMADNVLPLRA